MISASYFLAHFWPGAMLRPSLDWLKDTLDPKLRRA